MSFDKSQFVPGVFRCPKCEFRLHACNLNALDGSVTASSATASSEKCPNCAGPLWLVTWKDEALDAYKTAESQMERAIKAETELATLKEAAVVLQNGIFMVLNALTSIDSLDASRCDRCTIVAQAARGAMVELEALVAAAIPQNQEEPAR